MAKPNSAALILATGLLLLLTTAAAPAAAQSTVYYEENFENYSFTSIKDPEDFSGYNDWTKTGWQVTKKDRGFWIKLKTNWKNDVGTSLVEHVRTKWYHRDSSYMGMRSPKFFFKNGALLKTKFYRKTPRGWGKVGLQKPGASWNSYVTKKNVGNGWHTYLIGTTKNVPGKLTVGGTGKVHTGYKNRRTGYIAFSKVYLYPYDRNGPGWLGVIGDGAITGNSLGSSRSLTTTSTAATVNSSGFKNKKNLAFIFDIYTGVGSVNYFVKRDGIVIAQGTVGANRKQTVQEKVPQLGTDSVKIEFQSSGNDPFVLDNVRFAESTGTTASIDKSNPFAAFDPGTESERRQGYLDSINVFSSLLKLLTTFAAAMAFIMIFAGAILYFGRFGSFNNSALGMSLIVTGVIILLAGYAYKPVFAVVGWIFTGQADIQQPFSQPELEPEPPVYYQTGFETGGTGGWQRIQGAPDSFKVTSGMDSDNHYLTVTGTSGSKPLIRRDIHVPVGDTFDKGQFKLDIGAFAAGTTTSVEIQISSGPDFNSLTTVQSYKKIVQVTDDEVQETVSVPIDPLKGQALRVELRGNGGYSDWSKMSFKLDNPQVWVMAADGGG